MPSSPRGQQWPRPVRNRASSGACVAGPPTSGGQIPGRTVMRIGRRRYRPEADNHPRSIGRGMADPRGEPHWRSAVDVPLIVLATATVLSLIRSIDQPSFSLEVAGTEVTLVPADAALAVLAGFCRAPAAREGQPAPPSSRGHHRGRRVLDAGFSSRRPRTAPPPSSPRPSCWSTACSRSASSSSCGEDFSSGCWWGCWSPSPSWQSPTACWPSSTRRSSTPVSQHAGSRRSSGSTTSRRSRR